MRRHNCFRLFGSIGAFAGCPARRPEVSGLRVGFLNLTLCLQEPNQFLKMLSLIPLRPRHSLHIR
jgi:hypothetical protein